ncbi:MAG: DUF1810 domain-containing protein [Ruminococcaceae bacterium]|nr:DUF1810 domain-containing protein [Oscillospiraceae bacterium]
MEQWAQIIFLAFPAFSSITRALLEQPERNARTIFGGTDARKLRSCMTLFELADPECGLYSRVLEEFFQGRRDSLTLELLSRN